ncbi:MAG: glycerol-3-phosphate dehydrogenase/oxidase [Anaerolineales bacterium]
MNWTHTWRENAWNELQQDWDVLIIGGGITGAGILRQCVRAGLKAALVEAADFAAGTSSRSSKLVHGGMRYLKNAQVRVTLESVREREYLLKQGRGLIGRLGFLYPCLEGDHMPGWVFGAGLAVYDLMAGQWSHRSYDAEDMRELCPLLTTPALRGGFRFFDAQTDDARLVLRLIGEAVGGGGLALNYARVETLLKARAGRVCGAVVRDTSGGADRQAEVRARVVVNAAGAWADRLRGQVNQAPRLRPLRGSHLVFRAQRVPLTRAVTFLHPRDGRPVFVLPWEGAVIYGTTDVDQGRDLPTDPAISAAEAEYLLEGIRFVFPALELTFGDVIATFAGIRPVVNTGKANPSKESREHVIWEEDGLLTVSGGKLTTFRIMARDALKAVRCHLGRIPFDPDAPVLDPLPEEAEALLGGGGLPAAQALRLLARYGVEAAGFFGAAGEELDFIPGAAARWAELRWAARAEAVVHLEDLLLRRVRLGLLLPNGGLDQMSRIRAIVQPELGWDDVRWQAEETAYRKLWQDAYNLVK